MDARNFLQSSDYPMPALVWENSGNISGIGSYSTKGVTINHKLPFVPLLIGVWSDNSNFNPSYDISNFLGAANINGDLQLNACRADNIKVYVEGYNATGSTKTLYFRLLAFAPPDYDGEVPNLYDTTNFMLSTGFNYPKIVSQDRFTLSGGATKTIQHGLGYLPQCKVWGPDSAGGITPLYRMNSPSNMGGSYGPLVDTNSLTIKGQYAGTYYFHIYGDSADVNS